MMVSATVTHPLHRLTKINMNPAKNPLRLIYALALGAIVGLLPTKAIMAQSFLIGGFGDGIYSSYLSPDGKMSEPLLAVKQSLPAFFALHPKKDIVYAVTESGRNDAKSPAAITDYQIDRKETPSAKAIVLTLLNSQRIDGDAPCHVSIDATGEFLVVANYTSGSVVVCPIAADGTIQSPTCNVQHMVDGTNKQRQEKPHAHCSVWDPTNRYVFVSDLGLDKVFVYELERHSGKLVPGKHPSLTMTPGSGPRHISIHPNGKWVYIVNETNMTLTVAAWDATSAELTPVQTVSTLPANAKGKNFSTAEVLVHPSGRFVYSSNRGHDTIASFQVDEPSGKLIPIGHTSSQGKTPRNFRISPKGDFLLAENQQSNSIFSFQIDAKSGELTSTGSSIFAKAPACIKFLDR